MRKLLGVILSFLLRLNQCGAWGTAWIYSTGQTSDMFKTANDFVFPSSTWTIETWVKPFTVSSTFWLSFATSSNDNCILYYSSMFPVANVWYYAVVTYDGSSTVAYVDGVVSSAGNYASFCGTYTGSLVFGQEQDSLGGGYDANQACGLEQDTVAIYSTAWSSSEIISDKNYVDTTDNDLYALWIGGDLSGTDQTGNGNVAYITSSSGTTTGITTAAATPTPTQSPTATPAPTASLIHSLNHALCFHHCDDYTDQMGGGMDAALEGGAICEVGTGVVMDGIDSYVDLSSVELGGAMTFSVWARWDAVVNFGRIFDFSDGTSFQSGIDLTTYGENSYCAYYQYDSGASLLSGLEVGSDHITVGEWTHLVVTVGGTDVKLYQDGALLSSVTNDDAEIVSGTRAFMYLGRSFQSSPTYFSGAIKSFATWQRALSAAEVAHLHSSTTNDGCVIAGSLSPTPSPTPAQRQKNICCPLSRIGPGVACNGNSLSQFQCAKSHLSCAERNLPCFLG